MARQTQPKDAAWPVALLLLCGVLALAALAGLAGSAPATALGWPVWSAAAALPAQRAARHSCGANSR